MTATKKDNELAEAMKITLALLTLTAIASAQTKIAPPAINYSQYGSLSRQMAVYENTQLEIDKLDRERYRRFREEVRRNTPQEPAVQYVVLNRQPNYCTEERRCSQRR